MSILAQGRLAKWDVHQQWECDYRTGENKKFHELVFDYIADELNRGNNTPVILDAGCGICDYAVCLAKRGFLVHAVDFSEGILEKAREYVRAEALENRIQIQREDILSLSFEDDRFDHVLCWGVLMHIPDLEKAISELARVLKPGGRLIISEGNMFSLESIVLRSLRRLAGRHAGTYRTTPAGVESWSDDPTDPLLTREANVRWLLARLKSKGIYVRRRVSGQFTHMYIRISCRTLRSLIYWFNRFWFKWIKIPHLAQGNILILQKGAKG